MIIIWSNILVYTLVQKPLLPRLTLATECYYIFNTRIFGIQDCFTSSPHYKNHSDSGFVSHVIRLHISTSSCLLSRCVFRPALGCSSYTDISYQDIHIYLITIFLPSSENKVQSLGVFVHTLWFIYINPIQTFLAQALIQYNIVLTCTLIYLKKSLH